MTTMSHVITSTCTWKDVAMNTDNTVVFIPLRASCQGSKIQASTCWRIYTNYFLLHGCMYREPWCSLCRNVDENKTILHIPYFIHLQNFIKYVFKYIKTAFTFSALNYTDVANSSCNGRNTVSESQQHNQINISQEKSVSRTNTQYWFTTMSPGIREGKTRYRGTYKYPVISSVLPSRPSGIHWNEWWQPEFWASVWTALCSPYFTL